MKINLQTLQNNYHKQYKISKTNFCSGMTCSIANQIRDCDVYNISNNLAKKGINTEFHGNKTIAWCVNKVVEIYEQLNRNFGETLALPKEIYAENFDNLNINSDGVVGCCNFFPTKMYKNSDKVTKEQTVLFNLGIRDWNNVKNINKVSNTNYIFNHSSTSHFLNDFIHEFSHASHEEQLLNKLTPDELLEKITKYSSPQEEFNFICENGDILSREICDYAARSPLEAIACDMPKRIAKSLDRNLNLVKNPFEKTFYSSKPIEEISENKKTAADKLLEKFWNGNF